jgi:hypothetical protein
MTLIEEHYTLGLATATYNISGYFQGCLNLAKRYRMLNSSIQKLVSILFIQVRAPLLKPNSDGVIIPNQACPYDRGHRRLS